MEVRRVFELWLSRRRRTLERRGRGRCRASWWRARFRRAQVLNAVLRLYGLTAHDGGLIPGVQIGTLSGHQVIAADLAGV